LSLESGSLLLAVDALKAFKDLDFSSWVEKLVPKEQYQKRNYQEKIAEVSRWYKSERLVLILGSGASSSYGLPDWNTLLQKLLLITIKAEQNGKDQDDYSSNQKAGVLARTFSNVLNPNPLIAARYLNNYFRKNFPNSKLAFENAVRDALYSELSTKVESALLKEIRQYCIAAGRSPNIDSIITYNYDDLLEKTLKNIEVDIPFFPIHASGMRANMNELPIFHVHGYLPQSGKLTNKNKVILSEDEYHQQYTEIYGWNNLIQINKFKDYNCVFIGLSFTDPNLRRLLDISKKERGDNEIHHYCFKKRYNLAKTKEALEKLLSKNEELLDEKTKANLGLEEVSAELVKLMEEFEENDAFSFGVGIIWVDDYKNIPEILKEIRLNE